MKVREFFRLPVIKVWVNLIFNLKNKTPGEKRYFLSIKTYLNYRLLTSSLGKSMTFNPSRNAKTWAQSSGASFFLKSVFITRTIEENHLHDQQNVEDCFPRCKFFSKTGISRLSKIHKHKAIPKSINSEDQPLNP